MCGFISNGPNGDMFMNYMDYVDDRVKIMFSAGQALRMQANFGPGGARESLKSSLGLRPTFSISSTAPSVIACGDRTDYKFKVNPVSVGCGGGSLQYEWAATNGWTVTYPNQFYPQIIPNGTSGSTVTLTGTYINNQGVVLPMNTASFTVGYLAVPPTPVFIGGPAMLCSGQSATFSVTPVTGASGYRWTVPAAFTPAGQVITNGQTTTAAPSLTITPDAGLAGGTYSIGCQTLAGSGCPPSAVAYSSFDAKGGPQFMIVDVDPNQRFGSLVCQQNRIKLKLVPVYPGINATATGVTWTIGNWNSSSDAGTPLQLTYPTVPAGGVSFTMTARYTDNCGNRVSAIDYTAVTAASNITSLGNGYSCATNRYPRSSVPYPNPATVTLQLPGYRGQVVVYNQQGKPVQTLLAPGTDYGIAVDTSTWPEGLYVVTGRSLAGEFLRHNVQIQR